MGNKKHTIVLSLWSLWQHSSPPLLDLKSNVSVSPANLTSEEGGKREKAGIESFTPSKLKLGGGSACIIYSPVLGQILLTVGEIVRMCPVEKKKKKVKSLVWLYCP